MADSETRPSRRTGRPKGPDPRAEGRAIRETDETVWWHVSQYQWDNATRHRVQVYERTRRIQRSDRIPVRKTPCSCCQDTPYASTCKGAKRCGRCIWMGARCMPGEPLSASSRSDAPSSMRKQESRGAKSVVMDTDEPRAAVMHTSTSTSLVWNRGGFRDMQCLEQAAAVTKEADKKGAKPLGEYELVRDDP